MMRNHSTPSKAQRLRELLAGRTVAIPGACNALTAMQIERAGFEIVYVSGAAISAPSSMRTPAMGRLRLCGRPFRNLSGPDWQACRSKIRKRRKNAAICQGSD